MNQTDFAGLAGASKGAQINWEKDVNSPPASALSAWWKAGADVLYIVTASRTIDRQVSSGAPAGVTVRQALAMLDPADRHRLLLDLLAGELAR